MSFSQVSHGMLGENPANKAVGMRADLGCLFAAETWRCHEIGKLFWWIIRGIGHPGSRTLGPDVGFDELAIEKDP